MEACDITVLIVCSFVLISTTITSRSLQHVLLFASSMQIGLIVYKPYLHVTGLLHGF